MHLEQRVDLLGARKEATRQLLVRLLGAVGEAMDRLLGLRYSRVRV